MAETFTQKQVRLVLEKQCADMGRLIADSLPAGVGFCFIAFDFGNEGNAAYLSNGCREDTIKLLREMADKLEARSL